MGNRLTKNAGQLESDSIARRISDARDRRISAARNMRMRKYAITDIVLRRLGDLGKTRGWLATQASDRYGLSEVSVYEFLRKETNIGSGGLACLFGILELEVRVRGK